MDVEVVAYRANPLRLRIADIDEVSDLVGPIGFGPLLGHGDPPSSFEGLASLEGGDDQDYATMALWFRRLVPTSYRLTFFHPEAYPRRLELTMETTEQDLIDYLACIPTG